MNRFNIIKYISLLFIGVVVIELITNNYIWLSKNLDSIIQVLAGLGTFALALMTFVQIRERRLFEEKTYWNGIDVRVLESGTIIITNKAKEPIRVNHVVQDMINFHPISDSLKQDRFESQSYPSPETVSLYKAHLDAELNEGKDYQDKLNEITASFIENINWDGKRTIKGIVLNPQESFHIPDSLSYCFPDGDQNSHYSSFLCLMIVATNPCTNKKRVYKQVYRYSMYQPPEGWIRVI